MTNGEAKKVGRDLLDAAKRLKILELDVPGLGTVTLREMGGEERDMFDERMVEARKMGLGSRGVRALLIMLSMVDGPTGPRMFADADMAELNKLPGDISTKIAEAAANLSGIGAKALEAAEKNSVRALSELPSSDSPERSATQA